MGSRAHSVPQSCLTDLVSSARPTDQDEPRKQRGARRRAFSAGTIRLLGGPRALFHLAETGFSDSARMMSNYHLLELGSIENALIHKILR